LDSQLKRSGHLKFLCHELTVATRPECGWFYFHVVADLKCVFHPCSNRRSGLNFRVYDEFTKFTAAHFVAKCHVVNPSQKLHLCRLYLGSWAQFGGGHGGRAPHFFRRGDMTCHVLGFVFGEVSKN